MSKCHGAKEKDPEPEQSAEEAAEPEGVVIEHPATCTCLWCTLWRASEEAFKSLEEVSSEVQLSTIDGGAPPAGDRLSRPSTC